MRLAAPGGGDSPNLDGVTPNLFDVTPDLFGAAPNLFDFSQAKRFPRLAGETKKNLRLGYRLLENP